MKHYECRFRCPHCREETLVCHDWPPTSRFVFVAVGTVQSIDCLLPHLARSSIARGRRLRKVVVPGETSSQRGDLWTSLGREVAQLIFLTLIVYGIPLLVGGLLILAGHWF